MQRAISRRIAPIAGAVVFAVALAVLHRELAHLHFEEVVAQLRSMSASVVMTAVGLTVVSYLVLTLYDVLSVKYVDVELPYRRIAMVSFLGYSFAQNVGFTLFSGAPIRFRMYTAWGLSAMEVTAVVAFNAVSFWLGMLGVGGVALLLAGGQSPSGLHLPMSSLRTLGGLALIPVVAYLGACAVRRTPIEVGRWRWGLPPLRLALGQLVVAFADWILAAAVLFVLLPQDSRGHFIHFLAIFMLAQAAGLISQVPGGLGVFETVVLLVMPDSVSTAATLGSLVAFRVVYYLLPLAVALLLLAVYELAGQQQALGRLARFAGTSLRVVAPQLLALLTVAGGALLLLVGALPAAPERMAWVDKVLPLGMIEVSHFLASIVGVGLLLLGWAVLRRLEAAYYVTCGALAAGIVLSLLHGLHVEAATVLAAMLLVVLPARPYFYRRTSLFSEPFSPLWLAAVTVVLLTVGWIGVFAYHHVEYSSELWWQFALEGDASRFLRSGVGVALVLAVVGIIRLLGPAPPRSGVPDSDDLERVRAIVADSPNASANLALLGDKRFLFDDDDAFVMYAVQGRSWVAMGDPVGPSGSHSDLIWGFHELVDRHGGWTVFYEVGSANLEVYVDLGLTVVKIGEEAVVPLDQFSLEGGSRASLRRAINRVEREGGTFGLITPPDVPDVLSELREVSDVWLESKNTREKGFSLGRFDDPYLSQFTIAVVRRDSRIIAFANVWQGAAGGELAIDLMRYVPDAPAGIMDFLLCKIMLWGKDRGFSHFSLGMAPLAGLRTGPLTSLWNRLATVVYLHGEHFYNFRGLRMYKDRFHPEWRPRLLVCPGGAALPGVLADLASLISGGLLGALRK